MNLRNRLSKLEVAYPVAPAEDARQRLADYLDSIAERIGSDSAAGASETKDPAILARELKALVAAKKDLKGKTNG